MEHPELNILLYDCCHDNRLVLPCVAVSTVTTMGRYCRVVTILIPLSYLVMTVVTTTNLCYLIWI